MAVNAKDVKELRDRTDAPMMECKAALESVGGDLEKAIKVLRERGVAKMAKRADRETAEGTVRVQVGAGNAGGSAVVMTCETDFSARNEAFITLADAALAAAAALAPEKATIDAVLDSKAKDGRPVKAHLEDAANAIRENMAVKQVVRFGGTCGSYVHFDGKSGALVELAVDDPAKAASADFTSTLRDLCMHIVAIVPPPAAVDTSGIPADLIEQEKEIFIKQAMDSGKPREIAEKMVAGRLKKFVSERALLEQPFVKNPDQTVSAFLAAGAKKAGLGKATVQRFARLQIGGS